MSRLSIDISPEQHKQIKAMAAVQGKSIKDLVLERLFHENEDEDEDWLEFIDFLQDRIDSAIANPPSEKSIEDIAKEVIRRHS